MNNKIVKSVFILSLLGMSFTVPSAQAAPKKCYTIVAIAEVKIPRVGKEKNHGTLSNWKCRKEAHKREEKVANHKDLPSFLQFACNRRNLPRGTTVMLIGFYDRSRDSERRWKNARSNTARFLFCP